MSDPCAGFLVSSVAWQAMRHSEAIPRVRDAGFGGIEILCKAGWFEFDNPEHIDDIRLALDEWPDAVVTFHAPYYGIDLASTDPVAQDHAVEEMLDSLEAASRIGADNVTLHARNRESTYQWDAGNVEAFRRSLSRLVPAAVEWGMTLSVENLHPICFTSQADVLMPMMEGFPETLGTCIDVGHAHVGGRAVELARALAPRAFVLHLHDNNAQRKDEHLIPGHGTVPWSELISALRTQGFRGIPVMEVLMVESLNETLDGLKKAIAETGLGELVRSITDG